MKDGGERRRGKRRVEAAQRRTESEDTAPAPGWRAEASLALFQQPRLGEAGRGQPGSAGAHTGVPPAGWAGAAGTASPVGSAGRAGHVGWAGSPKKAGNSEIPDEHCPAVDTWHRERAPGFRPSSANWPGDAGGLTVPLFKASANAP